MDMSAPNLGFKHITSENWQKPDMPRYFPQMTKEIWIQDHLRPHLHASVPREVQGLFEAARGIMIYGWFFYPMVTLGFEQCFRALEAAAHHCCKKHGIPIETTDDKGKKRPVKYADQIKRLVEKNIISVDEESRWKGARLLRNHVAHPKAQMILSPGMTVSSLTQVAEDINRLFKSEV